MSREDDERLIRAVMKALSRDELMQGYAYWSSVVRDMQKPNNYLFLEESHAYAVLRRDDHREEAQRRGLL